MKFSFTVFPDETKGLVLCFMAPVEIKGLRDDLEIFGVHVLNVISQKPASCILFLFGISKGD